MEISSASCSDGIFARREKPTTQDLTITEKITSRKRPFQGEWRTCGEFADFDHGDTNFFNESPGTHEEIQKQPLTPHSSRRKSHPGELRLDYFLAGAAPKVFSFFFMAVSKAARAVCQASSISGT